MISFVSLLWVLTTATSPLTTPQNGEPPATLVSPDEARRAIIGCRLPEQRVSVSYEEDMQEDVVWIASDKDALSDSTLTCLARASLRTINYVFFRDKAVQTRYDSIYDEFGNDLETAEARDWLRRRNQLAAVPLPKKQAPLANYTKAVEAFCGVRPGSLLVARTDEIITFAEGGLGRITSNGIEGAAATTGQYECIRKVMSASDLESHGIFFGFIGNVAMKVR